MKGIVIKLAFAVVGIFIVAIGGAVGAYAFFNLDLPKIDRLQDYKPNLASQIYAKDGTLLAELGVEKREIVAIEDVPQRIINSFLAAEDDKFFEHKGVDYVGLSRAMLANLKAGRVVQGGSTITQQVAKSLLLTSERSYTRKLKDFILAQKIEKSLTKQEILFLYLNQVYLGGGYYGVKAAARGYFNKNLEEMTIAESAMLAGLLVAPGKYSPYVRPAAAKMRQGYVLNRLYVLNKITKEEYDEALAENIVYRIRQDDLKAGYFTEWVRQQVVEEVGDKNFLTNGYKVKTSLDWELQQVAEEQVQKGIKDIDKRQGYKGPIGVIKHEDHLDFIKNKRSEYYKNKSSYFVISDQNTKVYEFEFKEDEFQKLLEIKNSNQKELEGTPLVASVNHLDDLIKLLDNKKEVEAVVTHIDVASRLIYVDVMGVVGIIPHDQYKWAYKRSISENPTYHPPVINPNEVVKVGDIVHVTILDKSVGLANYIYKDNKDKLLKADAFNKVKDNKYVLCLLDQVAEVQGAIFSMDANTGEIISYVGGSDFSVSKFNRVIQAKRQPGSVFKPFLYASALEHGYDPTTIIMDTPEALPGFDSASSWKPKNYNGQYKGPMTFRNALEQSQNIPTIKIADRVGVNNILKFGERIGFNAQMQNDLSISLGTFVISPRDLVMGYAVMANGGKYVIPKGILEVTDRDGNIIEVNEIDETLKLPNQLKNSNPTDDTITSNVEEVMAEITEDSNPFTRSLTGDQVYDPRLAYIVNNLLKGVMQSGTGRAASGVSRNIAGKTGTTNDYLDAWFVGYNSKVVTAVWNGFDDNRTMGYGEVGGKAPLLAWRDYMKAVVEKYGDPEFKIPAGITQEWINKETGSKASPYAPGAILESFADVPKNLMNSDDSGYNAAPMGDDEYFENQ